MKLQFNKLFKGTQLSNENFNNLKLENKSFSEGRTIFRENESTTSIFLILEGEVNLITHQELEANKPNSLVLSEGDFFGYDEHYYSVPRKSRAIALTDSKIVLIAMEELNNLIVKDWAIIDNLKSNIHFPILVKKTKKRSNDNKPNFISVDENISSDISEKEFNRIQTEILKEKELAESEIDSRFSELNKKEKELLQLT